MAKLLYADDLKWAPRSFEATRVVAASWFRHDDRFEVEHPVRADGEEAYAAYWNITSERCLLRNILSLPVSPELCKCKELASAHPFGSQAPTYAELAKSRVKTAMVCLPLAVDDNPVGAVMARLYCVKGLHGKKAYPPPFKDGDKSAYAGYSWFLISGKAAAPTGESWQLAAHLLMRAVEDGKPNDRRRLARQFVATGAVSDGHLHKIGFGNKGRLAERPEFRDFTWIVPRQNAADVRRLPSVTAETVEGAWKQVAVGLSLETRELIGRVRNGVDRDELGDIRELIVQGADPNAVDEHGRNVRQYIMTNILDKTVEIVKRHAPDVDVHSLIREVCQELEPEWDADKMCSYYGNKPLMFFQLAHLGQKVALVELARKYDVGTSDRDGETALDFASEMGDKKILLRLEQWAGATLKKSSKVYSLTSRKMRMILHDVTTNFNADFLTKAFERGVDPVALTDFTVFSGGEVLPCRRKVWDNLAGRRDSSDYDPFDDEKSMVEITYRQTSLLQEAIVQKHKALVEMILARRKDVSGEICVEVGKTRVTDYLTLAKRFSSPAIYSCVKAASR